MSHACYTLKKQNTKGESERYFRFFEVACQSGQEQLSRYCHIVMAYVVISNPVNQTCQ